jgi:hypothetical protein
LRNSFHTTIVFSCLNTVTGQTASFPLCHWWVSLFESLSKLL